MSKKIKCSYFPLPALGEPIRLLLAYGGEDFENDCVTPDDFYAKVKQTLPFGQLPVYEENGKIANQSLAISRYLAKKYKLTGDNDWDDLEIDAIAETICEFVIKIAQYHYEQSASAKEKKKEVLFKETVPFYLEKFEKVAASNNGHFAIKRLTWADIFFVGVIEYFNLMLTLSGGEEMTAGRPNLAAVKEKVLKLPAIAKWYEKNPIDYQGIKDWLEMTGKPTQK